MKLFNDNEERSKFTICLIVLSAVCFLLSYVNFYMYSPDYQSPMDILREKATSDSTDAVLFTLVLAILGGIFWVFKEFWPGLLVGVVAVLVYYWVIKPWIKEAVQDAMRELLHEDYRFREDLKEIVREGLEAKRHSRY